MRGITIKRLIITVLGSPFVVVLYLNIEKYAEKIGYDVILIKALETGPNGDAVLNPLVAAALHPLALYGAIAATGIVAGLWLDAWLRRTESKKLPRIERIKNLGDRCKELATYISISQPHITYDNENMLNDIWAKWLPIQIELEKWGLVTPQETIASGDEVNILRNYSQFIGQLLLNGELRFAKKTAKSLCAGLNQPDESRVRRWLRDIGQRMSRRTRP